METTGLIILCFNSSFCSFSINRGKPKRFNVKITQRLYSNFDENLFYSRCFIEVLR